MATKQLPLFIGSRLSRTNVIVWIPKARKLNPLVDILYFRNGKRSMRLSEQRREEIKKTMIIPKLNVNYTRDHNHVYYLNK